MSPSPSIAILGAGAIGLYYGTKLALAGRDVRFLLRSDLWHVREHGIRIVLRDGALTLRAADTHAFGSTVEIGPVDLVLITLKTTANSELARMLPPLLHAGTTVVTLQNGLGNEELVASIAGPGRTLGGLCYFATMRTAPGEVTCFLPGSITLGEYGRPVGERACTVAALLNEAGVKTTAVDNLAEARWRKLAWNIPFNGLSIAAGGITTDRICADPALAAEVHALMAEVAAAAGAQGYSIPAEFMQKQFDITPPMGPYQPSSLVDFLAGRPVEIEPIWGEPLRRAQAAGVAVPRMALLYALVRRLCADRGVPSQATLS